MSAPIAAGRCEPAWHAWGRASTGGLRICAAQILQRVPNNYETDLIYPIVAAAARLAGLDYHTASEREKTSLKVRAAASNHKAETPKTEACATHVTVSAIPSSPGT